MGSGVVWHLAAALLWGSMALVAQAKQRWLPDAKDRLFARALWLGSSLELVGLVVELLAFPGAFAVGTFLIDALSLGLRNASIILIVAGFLRYFSKPESTSWTAVKSGIGIGVVAASVLLCFWRGGSEGATLAFEATWCSGGMHLAVSCLLAWLLYHLWTDLSGWCRRWVSLAVLCFWLVAALSVREFATDSYQAVRVVKHVLLGLGIAGLGFVCLRELFDRVGREIEQQRVWKERFEAFMDNSPFIAWVKNSKGEHEYLSQPYALQIGIPITDWQGKTDYDLWPKEIAESHREMDRVAMETGKTIAFESNHPLPSGEVKDWYVVKFSFRVGHDQEMFIGGISLDVTDRKQAERDRDRFFENSSELMCIADRDMHFKRVNRAFTDILGYPREELTGRSFRELVHPEDLLGVDMALERGNRNVKSIQFETRFQRKDGSYRLIDWTTPVADSGSAQDDDAVFAVGRDVTDQRSLERRLLKIADDEQRRIAHDLHDGLGQELTGLAMMAESLALNLKDSGNPEFELAHKIALQLEASQGLTRMLARGLRPIEIDSAGLESALSQLAEKTTERYRIDCRFESDRKVGDVDPDTATQLYRIAQEAITNAARHAQPESIRIMLSKNSGVLELKIADDGSGITDLGQSQAGIGMKSMQYRSDAMGGSLSVDPNTPRGTIVCCRVGSILTGT